jgi:hypothetical protein
MAQVATPIETEIDTEQSTRNRFSFGPVWNAAVIAGKVKDHEKLIAHAVKLKIAAKSDASRLKFEILLDKVSTALQAPAEAEPAKNT